MEPEKDIFDEWAEKRDKESWIVRKLRFIPLWWSHEGKYLHLEFKRGVKNLIYWFPIIWKDRNWDSHYIFDIMKHKLTSQSNYIGRRDFHTRAQLDAKRMRLCVKLMGLVQDEFYSSEYSDDYFKKYPLIYKRVLNGDGLINREGREDDKQLIAMSIGYINHDRARKLLFKIMEENIEGWWD